MQAMQFIDTQRTSIKGNCAYTIDMAATTSYNNVIGNIIDVAVSNLGTGNTVANNTIY
jgi:hypothetical protein